MSIQQSFYFSDRTGIYCVSLAKKKVSTPFLDNNMKGGGEKQYIVMWTAIPTWFL